MEGKLFLKPFLGKKKKTTKNQKQTLLSFIGCDEIFSSGLIKDT